MNAASFLACMHCAQQSVPANLERYVHILNRYNARIGRGLGSSSVLPDISWLESAGNAYQVRFAGQAAWLSVALHETEGLKSFWFYNTTSKRSSFATFDAPTWASSLAREVGWLNPNSAVEAISNTGPNELTVLLHRKVNSMLEYRPATVVFATDGGLIRGNFPSDLKNIQFNVNTPRLAAELCMAKALDYYWSFKPHSSAEILSQKLYFGLPPGSVNHPDPELSETQITDFQSSRPFPFYMFVLADSELRESSWMQWIAVDARDGSLVSFSDFGGGFGPKGKARAALKPVLNKTTVGKVMGTITPVGKLSARVPVGTNFLVRSGNGV